MENYIEICTVNPNVITSDVFVNNFFHYLNIYSNITNINSNITNINSNITNIINEEGENKKKTDYINKLEFKPKKFKGFIFF